jgi:hypothetical protein
VFGPLLVVPIIYLSFILFNLLVVSLSGSRSIILAPDLFFHSARSSFPGHIRQSLDISDLRPNISGPLVLTCLNQVRRTNSGLVRKGVWVVARVVKGRACGSFHKFIRLFYKLSQKLIKF